MELKALMVAGLGGDAAAYRSLLDGLSRRLRAYYKGKLARVGHGATEAEDLVQEVLLAIPPEKVRCAIECVKLEGRSRSPAGYKLTRT